MKTDLPDSPCLGFCTTALGDDVCKSCGRTFEEVCQWITMTSEQKAATRARIRKNDWWDQQRKAKGL